jgi:hypothetical protein
VLTLLLLLCIVAGATNSRSDRIAQALSASSDAITAAVTGSSNAATAAQRSKAFATLATRDSTRASDFGRRLQQGKAKFSKMMHSTCACEYW